MKEDYSELFVSLLVVCRKGATGKMLAPLLQKGGKDLVLKRHEQLQTALHIICIAGTTDDEVVRALLDIGRQHLVEASDDDGKTALHHACSHGASVDVAWSMLKVGEDRLAMKNDDRQRSPLHCINKCTPVEVIDATIERGGAKELFPRDDDGDLPVDCLLQQNK